MYPPSTDLQVMTAVPTFLPVTVPDEDTVATEVLLEDHFRLLFVA